MFEEINIKAKVIYETERTVRRAGNSRTTIALPPMFAKQGKAKILVLDNGYFIIIQEGKHGHRRYSR